MDLEIFLRPYWATLTGKTKNLSQILKNLNDENVLSKEEIEEIKNTFQNANSNKKFDYLYKILLEKKLSLEILKKVLLETSNEHIVLLVWGNSKQDLDSKFWKVGTRDGNFTGREKIFEILENGLESKMWEKSTLKFVLYGNEGCGKSSIVTEFTYRNRGKFFNIFRFGADDKSSLSQQICQLALDDLKISEQIGPKEKLQFATKFMKDWFEQKCNFGWLIILDNVENFQDIQNFVPRFGGVLIATSRTRTNLANFSQIRVGEFESSEVYNFMGKVLSNENRIQFQILSVEMGWLPLAVANACYSIKSHGLTIQEFCKINKNSEKKEISKFRNSVERSIWRSVQFSLDKNREESPLAFQFLQIISYLRAENIPEFFLTEFIELSNFDYNAIFDVRKVLLKYNLVKLEIRGNVGLYSIHRLVQKSIKQSVENDFEILLPCFRLIIRVCKDYICLDSNYILHHATHLLLNLIEFSQKRENLQDIGKLHKLNNEISILINVSLISWLSEIENLENIFSEYFEAVKKLLDNRYEIFSLYLAMDRCFEAKGYFENSLQVCEELLLISREKFGEISQQTADIYARFGANYYSLSVFSRALEFYEKSLEIDNKLHGVDSSKLFSQYSNLGDVCIKLEEYKKAQEYLKKGLKLAKTGYYTPTILANLAHVGSALGELESAKEYFDQCFSNLTKSFREESILLSLRLKEFGDFIVERNPTFALRLYEKVLDLETKYHNGPSEDILDKIRDCNHKIKLV